MRRFVVFALLVVASTANATYSIVARDPDTGELGVAVQTHWFNVGALVPWAESGVGAVATQSLVDPSYGRGAADPAGGDDRRIGRRGRAHRRRMHSRGRPRGR